MDIHNLTAQVRPGARTNQFALPADQEAVLDEFVEWLVKVEGKTVNTARSYRSYCAKALKLGQDWSEMTSDQRSAVRKLAEFTK